MSTASDRRRADARPTDLPVFDVAAFVDAYDTERRARGLGWYEFADELWEQSSEPNARLVDHARCGGAVSRQGARGATSCRYALFLLRWLAPGTRGLPHRSGGRCG